MLPRANHFLITFIFLGLTGLISCGEWEGPEEVKKAVEEEPAPIVSEGEDMEGYEELKGIMASASRHMKKLEGSLARGSWPTARESAKVLEELIGRRCVNSYIKLHGEVPQDFVHKSQRFNDAVLRLLVAERHQDVALANSQFQLMRQECEECHQRYRKEGLRSGG